MGRFTNQVIIFLLILTCGIHLQGQDIHFTQYSSTALVNNPALTALMNGDYRGGAVYRQQWRSAGGNPFNTIMAFADMKLHIGRFHKAGAGMIFYNDKSGPGEYEVNSLYLSGAYHHRLNSNVFLAAGFQPGMITNSINTATLPRQWNPHTGQFDYTLPSGEPVDPGSTSFFDLNAGLAITYSGDFLLTAGQALFHVTEPHQSLIRDNSTRLPMRSHTHLQVYYPIGNYMVSSGANFMYQNLATQFNINSFILYRMPSSDWFNSMRVGFNYRNNIFGIDSNNIIENVDAMSFIISFIQNDFDLGFAYDFNISNLRNATSYRGGLEILLIYQYPDERKMPTSVVPCFRF